jgi:ribulose 1,5-bisphosphate carboxylase large subunit-like protein
MHTKNQLIRHAREDKQRTDCTRASNQCPQKQGVCLRVSTRTPPEEAGAAGAAESSTGTWTTVWTDVLPVLIVTKDDVITSSLFLGTQINVYVM